MSVHFSFMTSAMLLYGVKNAKFQIQEVQRAFVTKINVEAYIQGFGTKKNKQKQNRTLNDNHWSSMLVHILGVPFCTPSSG